MFKFFSSSLFQFAIKMMAGRLDDLLALGFHQLIALYKRERKEIVVVIGKAIRKTPLGRRATPEELEEFAEAWDAFLVKYEDTKEYKRFEKAMMSLVQN